MKLSKREKKLLYELLRPSYALQALSSEFENNDNKEAKANFGMSVKAMGNCFTKIVQKLEKDIAV